MTEIGIGVGDLDAETELRLQFVIKRGSVGGNSELATAPVETEPAGGVSGEETEGELVVRRPVPVSRSQLGDESAWCRVLGHFSLERVGKEGGRVVVLVHDADTDVGGCVARGKAAIGGKDGEAESICPSGDGEFVIVKGERSIDAKDPGVRVQAERQLFLALSHRELHFAVQTSKNIHGLFTKLFVVFNCG